MDLPLLALLLLAAIAHAGVLLVIWSLLVRTGDGSLTAAGLDCR